MWIKQIFIFFIFFTFGFWTINPGTGFCDEKEVYSKLPKNPGGDPELSDEAWDAMDEKLSASKSSCVRCHYEEEKYEKLTISWDQSKHSKAKVSCVKCHGGNAESPSIGKSKSPETKFKKLDTRFKDKIASLENFDDLAFEYCGQCHGTIYRDWKTGIHGKRTGFWNGEKEYRLCVFCHNPHDPKFPNLRPMPPPVKPININMKSFLLMKSLSNGVNNGE